MANLALIHPIATAVGATRAAAAWACRRYKTAALEGVYPGSPEHQAALKSVEDRTAPQFAYWSRLPTAMQTAHDQAAIEHADTGPGRPMAEPRPSVRGRGGSVRDERG
ncbi:hypothetical protein [Streptomyces nojiriensis]|uniref:hypothetical protein n=1 Tax=Streptomyces nojiriensis TaxID=66374 RepID=UPI0035DC9AE9